MFKTEFSSLLTEKYPNYSLLRFNTIKHRHTCITITFFTNGRLYFKCKLMVKIIQSCPASHTYPAQRGVSGNIRGLWSGLMNDKEHDLILNSEMINQNQLWDHCTQANVSISTWCLSRQVKTRWHRTAWTCQTHPHMRFGACLFLSFGSFPINVYTFPLNLTQWLSFFIKMLMY